MVIADSIVEYRDVPGFPGYRVGSDGSLWSKLLGSNRGFSDTWRRLKPGNSKGYHLHLLYNNGKRVTRFVHRLVLEAFVGPRPDSLDHQLSWCWEGYSGRYSVWKNVEASSTRQSL